jgi:hypothetical protein
MVSHHLGKLDPDPHQSEKQDPSPYQCQASPVSASGSASPSGSALKSKFKRCKSSQWSHRVQWTVTMQARGAQKCGYGRRFEITLMRTRIRIRITAGSRILIHIKVKKSDLDPNQKEKRNPLVRMRIKMKTVISLMQIRNTDLIQNSALLSHNIDIKQKKQKKILHYAVRCGVFETNL